MIVIMDFIMSIMLILPIFIPRLQYVCAQRASSRDTYHSISFPASLEEQREVKEKSTKDPPNYALKSRKWEEARKIHPVSLNTDSQAPPFPSSISL